MSEPYQERFFTSADGLQLYYRDYPGSGPVPVLCLHGLTRNSRDFARLAAHLSPRHRVLAADFRGRGRSAWDPNWQNYHPGTYVADVLQLLTHAEVPRVALIGTSLGGIVAMLLGAAHGARIAGIVVNDIGPEVARAGLERIASYVGRSAPAATWADAARQTRSTYELALPEFTEAQWEEYARRSWREREDGVPVPDMDPMVGEAVRQPRGAAPAPDLWPLWPALGPIPMLAIRGVLSDLLSAETFERMAQERPNLERLVVPNRGHAPTLEEPECIAAIERFLAALR